MQKLRSLLRFCRAGAGQARAQVLRKLGKSEGNWETALHGDELLFWEKALTNPGKNWLQSEFNERTDPDLELQPFVKELIDAPVGASVRILDVGAGPLTRLGKKWEGRSLQIIAVDPLAKEYDVILEKSRLVPKVRTTFGLAEDLVSTFPISSFDFAYASNALDHSRDPLQAIRQMLAVVKPGRYAYLWHFANAGVVERYHGLHQWNFDIEDGDFVVGDGRKKFSLTKEMSDVATMTSEVQQAFNSRVVVAKLRKHAPTQLSSTQ